MELTLTPSVYYQDYNISCNGLYDGTVTTSVTGGTSPYTYLWSNGATTQNLADLPAGYYAVTVTDAASATVEGGVTLTEPSAIRITLTPFEYSNGYNVNPYGNYNGSIDLTVEGGEPPYTYLWSNNATTQNIASLNADEYVAVVTDAAGCIGKPEGVFLKQPEGNDWQMTGNAGSNPATQFIGTTDAQDVSFRSNNVERMRITGIGDIKINTLQGTGNRMVYADANGNLKVTTSNSTSVPVPWFTFGNQVTPGEFIGSVNNEDFLVRTNNLDRIIVTASGNVGIGATVINKKLVVNGDVSLISDNDNNNLQMLGAPDGNPPNPANYNLPTVYPQRRGIVLDNDPGGLFDFFIHKWQNNASFNFKAHDETSYTMSDLMTITKDGNVGMGTANPSVASFMTGTGTYNVLEIEGDNPIIRLHDNVAISPYIPADFYLYAANGTGRLISDESVAIFLDADDNSHSTTSEAFTILKDQNYWGNDAVVLFKVNSSGYVGARGVKVTQGGFPDYVFKEDYPLMSLHELDNYIKQNQHLPGIPTACEVEDNGLDLGEMQVTLVKKIEELTLYVIELKKENEEIKNELKQLKK